ncbi:MAG: glycosyltransferase family 2 protein [Candidatus Aenigmatarchaeota archaeon]
MERGAVKLNNKPLVSIIIPTYNSGRFLEKCLKSVKGQTYPNIEVIVVDNYSRDKTREIAEKYGAKVFQLNAERGEAKNFGLKKAEGKYVCFIDSDMELTKNVIEKCVNLMEGYEKLGGIIIPERSVGNSFWVKVRDFERSFYAGTEIESARFFRKDLCERVNGFDEDIVAFEESTLPQKIEKMGYDVKQRVNAEILHHEENFSLQRWLKKKFYYGKSAFKYKEKFGEYASKQMSIYYRFSILLKNKRFYSKPLLALGVIVLKILEYFSAGLGYLASRGENEGLSIGFYRYSDA